MPKASPVLLVALLLVAALAVPASVGGVSLLDSQASTVEPSVGISENTTRVLRLDQIQASGFGEPHVVVLQAAAMQEAELDSAYSIAVLEERLAVAPNRTARREVLQNYTEAAATEVRELQAAERDARTAYMAGDISTQEYAQRLAVIQARAASLARFIGGRGAPSPALFTYASPYGDIQDRVAYLYEELQYLTGPVRAEMAAAVRGDRPPVRVFLAAGETGFELSYVRPDGVYVRSVYRADTIDTNTSGAGGIQLILNITPDLYPWASESGSLSATVIPQHGTIRTTIFHSQGRVQAYIDETTRQVYYEVQYKRLETIPVEYAFNRTRNGTRVLVSETYPGGPLQVKVLDVSGENTTAYVSVPVTLNETITHQTNGDGVAWFVSPAGTYNVTTAANNTKFHFTVTA